MKKLIIFFVFLSLSFPVFSQSTSSQSATAERMAAFGDTLGMAVNRSTAKLADFDSQVKDDGAIKVYTSYLRKYDSLSRALTDSERKLNLYLRTNERVAIIRDERDNYEYLVRQLQNMKTEYDDFLRRTR